MTKSLGVRRKAIVCPVDSSCDMIVALQHELRAAAPEHTGAVRIKINAHLWGDDDYHQKGTNHDERS